MSNTASLLRPAVGGRAFPSARTAPTTGLDFAGLSLQTASGTLLGGARLGVPARA